MNPIRHKQTRNLAAALFAAVGLLGSSLAGTYVNDFSNSTPVGMTLNGGLRDDGVTPYPAIEGGKLALVYAENSKQGSAVLDDLDPGATIESFNMSFKLRIGGGSSTPADGIAIFLGPVDSTANFGEEGPAGLAGLTISFDIFDNGGGEAPAIEAKVNEVVVGRRAYTIFDIISDTFSPVTVVLTKNGRLTVTYKGQPVVTDLFLPGYAPAAGDRFAFGARTGGLNANQWIDDLNIATVVAAPTAASIGTQPASLTVAERAPATFTVVANGSAPFTFQWLSNNVAIDGATSATYAIANAPASANGAIYKVTVTNGAGSATSADAILTVTSDTVKPTVASVSGNEGLNAVTVTFSEPITEATLGAQANYALSGGLTISAIQTLSDRSVRLTTSAQTAGTQYTLTVNNITDTAATPNVITADTTANFTAWVLSRGFLKFEYYGGIGTTAVQALLDDQRFQAGTPDQLLYMTSANTRTVFPDDSHENYGARISGYLLPTVSGDYRFFISSDDASQLSLSTDASPANLAIIANEPGCCNGFAEPSETNPRTSAIIPLVAGNAYFLEGLVKEGGGGDYMLIAWRKEGDTTPAGSLQPIPGSFLGTYADPGVASINFTTQPPANRTASENTTTTFTVAATGAPAPLTFQWQRKAPGATDFTDIAGATGTSYTSPILKQADDNGATYRVLARVPGASVASTETALTVIIDSTPPQLVAAAPGENQKLVTLTFSEALTASSVTAANFAIPGLTVSAATLRGELTVLLTTSPQTAGTTYTVTVSNVRDSAGNVMDPAANSKTFAALAIQLGVLKFESYYGMGGTAVADLLNSPKYPNSPSAVRLLASFNSGDAAGDNFGGRLSGFIIPAESGDYRFFLNSDDSSSLWLSTDDSPANLSASPIANEPGCCNAFSEPDGVHTRTSAPIPLVAGQKYYVLYIFKEGGGGDYGRVAWRLETDTTPAASLQPIPGQFLAAAMDVPTLNGFILANGSALGTGTGAGGFKAKVHQVAQTGSNPLITHIERAEQQLQGVMGPSVADPAGSTAGVWTMDSIINWNQELNTGGTLAEAGSFTSVSDPSRPDVGIPGIPGTGPVAHNTDSIAGELVTYVEFPTAGVHYLGVNSDDGFAVTGSDQAPANNGALVISGPASIAGSYHTVLPGTDGTGFPRLTAPITGKLVYAEPGNGCSPLTNPDQIRGNIALIDRGVCTFVLKAESARNAGAIAVIIANSRDPESGEGAFPVVMGGGIDFTAIMISKPDGTKIKTAVGQDITISVTPDNTPRLGQFNAGRGATDTIFPVIVPAAGVYPLRTVWFEGGGGANLEWFSVTATGEKILLNDRANANALKTYTSRGASVTPTISAVLSGGNLVITYTGNLYASDNVAGPYVLVPGASPANVPTTGTARFFQSGP